jgi:Putative cell-wall binding lipoprotein
MNKQTAVEEMYEVLEKVVSAEKLFEEQQDPLVSLEKKEKEIYNQIMALGMKQHDQIIKLSDEALSMVEMRKEHLEKEIASLESAEKEFKKVEAIKEKIKDPDQRKLADDLYDIMIQRYKAYNVLSTEYSEALKNDKELYMMLKSENPSFENIEKLVMNLNQSYQKVFEANEDFNNLTAQYNEKKLEFYKKSGLKVETKE